MSDSGNCDVPLPPEQGNKQNDSVVRTRIAAAVRIHREELNEENVCICGHHGNYPKHVADAVIRELDTVLVDFGLWLAEEITGRAVTRIDLESCLEDWKGGGADE